MQTGREMLGRDRWGCAVTVVRGEVDDQTGADLTRVIDLGARGAGRPQIRGERSPVAEGHLEKGGAHGGRLR